MFGFQFDSPSNQHVSWWGVELLHIKGEGFKEQRERRKREWALLKEKGYTSKNLRFHYKTLNDAKGNARAEKKARALAEYVTKVTGVEVYVANGSYL